jgi:hypothetical protein
MADMAAAPLSDGRLQVWVIDQGGNVRFRWKETTDPNSAWTGWSGSSTCSTGLHRRGATTGWPLAAICS